MRVRIGIHTGEGRAGGDDYVGLDVHRAARISAAAHGGQVVVSQAAAMLVGQALPSDVTLRDLGAHRLKDLSEPERIHQLVIDGLPNDFPPLRSLDAHPSNLPSEPSRFLGRRRELDELVGLIRSGRLVTLTGPGGVGKTRLAIEAARTLLPEHSDGAFFVPLETATGETLVASGIATSLGVGETATRDLDSALRERLRDRELLLVLDNFEQVAAAAPLVRRLLDYGPHLRALITSRTPLHVPGEQEYELPPMAVSVAESGTSPGEVPWSDAMRLFVERARQVKPSFNLDNEDANTVIEICRRLDGLPLAIELAAARVKLLPPTEILRRLEHRLEFLVGTGQDRPDRHRTMNAAIGWSDELLTDAERDLFVRLSVFAGGWTVEAAEFVCDPDEIGADVLSGLGSLLDKSLIRRQPGQDVDARFAMLQVIHEYAAQQLVRRNERDRIARRHASFMLRHFEGVDLEGQGGRASVEIENLRAALSWAVENEETDIALRLAGTTWRLWQEAGKLSEARDWTEMALRLPGADAATTARGIALTGLGGLMYWQGDNDELERVYSEALAIHSQLEEPPLMAEALRNVAFARLGRGDHESAREHLARSAEVFRELGQRGPMATAQADLAYVEAMLGDETAPARLIEAAAIHHELGMKFRYFNDLGWLATIDLVRGDYAAARNALIESLAFIGQEVDLARLAIMFRGLARVALETGDVERAVVLGSVAARLSARSEEALPDAIVHSGDPVADARQKLSEERHAELVTEGEAMSIDEALAYARQAPA
ncbi:MAG: tetratricopeptide repeat protein [Gemmatimonadota bacterium]|nr:tetratricopeptide repeat protein [Gemmatimonadota bacterium]